MFPIGDHFATPTPSAWIVVADVDRAQEPAPVLSRPHRPNNHDHQLRARREVITLVAIAQGDITDYPILCRSLPASSRESLEPDNRALLRALSSDLFLGGHCREELGR